MRVWNTLVLPKTTQGANKQSDRATFPARQSVSGVGGALLSNVLPILHELSTIYFEVIHNSWPFCMNYQQYNTLYDSWFRADLLVASSLVFLFSTQRLRETELCLETNHCAGCLWRYSSITPVQSRLGNDKNATLGPQLFVSVAYTENALS